MVLMTARPTIRTGSSNAQFQRRVPADVLKIARGRQVSIELPPENAGEPPLRLNITLGDMVRFSLRTQQKGLREVRHAAVIQQLEAAYRGILAGPKRLSLKERTALSGVLYRDLAAQFDDDPVSATWWNTVGEVASRALAAPVLKRQLIPGEGRLQQLESYVGPFLDATLLREGVIADPESRLDLLQTFATAIIDVAKSLKNKAEGDYTPDPAANRFPVWERGSAKKTVLTFDELLERWKRESPRAASSIASFEHHVDDLKRHLGHNDARRVTKTDAVSWKDQLLKRGLKAKTINGSYLASIGALYNLAKRDDLLDKNPTEDVRIPYKQNAVDPLEKTYTDSEVAIILSLANKEALAYLHWVPWLTALTGARVSEIVQLWGTHVEYDGGIHCIRIAPTDDGGTLKTGSSKRIVPLHPAIIDRGFLDFVATRYGGPLFYGDAAAEPRQRKSETAAHASKGPANRVREWIRRNGFDNPRKAPNHAFRYWFKAKCAELDIPDSVADAIQGHSDGSVARAYRGIALAKKAEAIAKIVVPIRSA